MKSDRKNTEYYKSGKHVANSAAARAKALLSNQKRKQERIRLYNEDPVLCRNESCKGAIPYEKKANKFCCKSCAAQHNNKQKGPRTEAQKKAISAGLKVYQSTNPIPWQHTFKGQFCKVVEIECKICHFKRVVQYQKRHSKTCGKRRCKTIASTGNRTYQNGSRKPVWYFNINENKEVLLDSSWEVEIAKYLDSLNMEWIRPAPIDWEDSNGIDRLYYPDFYLVKYDVYLDPKNPYCMEKDKEKMSKIQKKVALYFGSLEVIKETIERLKEDD